MTETSSPRRPSDELNATALSAIRDLIDEQKQVEPAVPIAPAPARPSARARLAKEVPLATEQPEQATARKVAKKAAKKSRPTATRRGMPIAPGIMDRIKGFRPNRKVLIMAAVALFVLWRPWLTLGLVMLSVMLMIGLFLTLGPDTIWHWIMNRLKYLNNKRPAVAQRLLLRLDRFAGAWDRFLDFFPEGMVDDFYMPDFNALIEADARHGDVLDRRLGELQQG